MSRPWRSVAASGVPCGGCGKLLGMNNWLVALGIEGWKAWIGLLVQPLVPLLAVALLGALLLRRRPVLGRSVVLSGLVGLWLLCTPAMGLLLTAALTRPPPALTAQQVGSLKGAPHTAIWVLGAGRRLHAPEYGGADLKPLTLERLRYALWLARQTGLPVGYSGGLGHGSEPGPSEAEVAGQVAERDFGQPLRWREDRSRDTSENAQHSVALLRNTGITHVVLVTHGFHQQRAGAAFSRAIGLQGSALQVTAASVGLRELGYSKVSDWVPTAEGLAHSSWALHEWLGWLGGA